MRWHWRIRWRLKLYRSYHPQGRSSNHCVMPCSRSNQVQRYVNRIRQPGHWLCSHAVAGRRTPYVCNPDCCSLHRIRRSGRVASMQLFCLWPVLLFLLWNYTSVKLVSWLLFFYLVFRLYCHGCFKRALQKRSCPERCLSKNHWCQRSLEKKSLA